MRPLAVFTALLALSGNAHAAALFTSDFGDSLTAANDAASDGDVILVDSIVGCADIDRRLTIVGAGGAIDCASAWAVELMDDADGTTLSGLSITSSGGSSYGVRGNDDVDDITILDCTLVGADEAGIFVDNDSEGWRILRNDITVDDSSNGSNDGGIVAIAGTSDLLIAGNVVTAVHVGIRTYNGAPRIDPISNVTIRDNTVLAPTGLSFRGRDAGSSQHDLRIVDNDLSAATTALTFRGASIAFAAGSDTSDGWLDTSEGDVAAFWNVHLSGNATAGADLSVSRTVDGAPVDLSIDGAEPGATVFFLASTTLDADNPVCHPVFTDVCTPLRPPTVLGSLTADGDGRAALTIAAPPASSGDVSYQAAWFSASEGAMSNLTERRVAD